MRWDYQEAPPLDGAGDRRAPWQEREAAFGRLATAVAGALPVVDQREGRIMITSQTEQTIERDATEIWAYAADIARHPEWMSVTDAAILRGVGSEVGSRARERLALGPFKWDVEFEVAKAVAGATDRVALD